MRLTFLSFLCCMLLLTCTSTPAAVDTRIPDSPPPTSPAPANVPASPDPGTISITALPKVWFSLASEQSAWPDGMVSGKSLRSYSADGRLFKEEQYDADGKLTSSRVYRYPGNSVQECTNLNHKILDKDGPKVMSTVIRVFRGALVLSARHLGPDGSVQTTEQWEYDTMGKKLRWMVNSSAGQTVTIYRYREGLLEQTLVNDAGGTLIKSFRYSYDSDGQIQTEEEYASDGLLISRTSHIRKNGLIVRTEQRDRQGITQSARDYQNDENGNVVQIKLYDRRSKLYELRTRSWQRFEILPEAIPYGVDFD